MRYQRLLKLTISITVLFLIGCNKESDNKSQKSDVIINYQQRNKIFEEYLFGKKDYNEIFSIKNGTEYIVNYERIKINLLDLNDSIIKYSKIKSIEEVEHSFKFGKQVQDGIKKYLIKFNKSGKSIEDNIFDIERDKDYDYYPAKINYFYSQDSIISKISIFNLDMKALGTVNYEYNNELNMISKEKVNLYLETESDVSNERINKRRSIKFRSIKYVPLIKQKRFKKIFNNDISEIDFNFRYRYDSIGKKIELVEWFKSGTIHKKEVYSYDPNKNIAEAIYYDWNHKKNKIDKKRIIKFLKNNYEIIDLDLDGNLNKRTVYNFNENFKIKEITEFNKESYVNWKIICNYNINKEEVERFYYIGDQLDKQLLFEYNDKNQIVKKKIIPNDKNLNFLIEYKYNDHGFISEELVLNFNNEQINRSIYKYNENGNIQEYTEFDNLNEPIKLTSFNYEYYN